jgi:ubiquinone/menaquinone biosynthesis C-methylase UbiE
MIKTICPHCHSDMIEKNNEITCSGCKTVFSIKDGLKDFRKGDEPYWCEVSQNQMPELLNNSKNTGWHKAIKEFCDKRKDSGLYKMVTDQDRASWHYLVPIERNSTVLDVGSGWGSITFSLAKYYSQVVSLDNTYERISFSNIRKNQDNINNIQCICGSVLKLPFPDKTFDLVVMNGVLEWMGLSDNSKPVETNQLNSLREINRVLKKDGHIYLAIENRFGIDMLLGYRDHHSMLKFATIMPRFMADIYSRIVRKKPYRTYTYSMIGLKKLLYKSGFTNEQFYYPVNSYRKFYYIIPLHINNPLEYCFTNLLPEKLLYASNKVKKLYRLVLFAFRIKITGLLRYFVTSYSIIARKSDDI